MRYAHLVTVCLPMMLLVTSVAANLPAKPVAFMVFFEDQSADITTRFAGNIDNAFQVDRFSDFVEHEGRNGWVRVVSHVDFQELGPKASVLGFDRAKAVTNELIIRGIDAGRIVTMNQGTQNLIFQDMSAPANRYVEVTLCKGRPPSCTRVYYN